MKRFSFSILLLFIILSAWGQNADSTLLLKKDFLFMDKQSVKRTKEINPRGVYIHFKIGSAFVDSTFRDNEKILKEIITTLQFLKSNALDYRINRVVVAGTASPLGGNLKNEILSKERAESMQYYLQKHTDLPDTVFLQQAIGPDWERLYEMVEQSDMLYREEILEIVRSQPVHLRNNKLMNLRWGRPYREMMETFFPDLQSAGMVKVYALEKDLDILERTKDRLKKKKIAEEEERSYYYEWGEKERYRSQFNISTNLLYWIGLAPNVGLEYCFDNSHWSFGVDVVMPWWKNNTKHKYYQISQTSLEGRYWLKGNGAFRGHFLGIYGNGGVYDLENGKTGYKGEFGGGGFTYGYVLPFNSRLKMEFSLGAGYVFTRFEEYKPIDTHYVYQRTRTKNYIGPTKVEVGLVWMLMGKKR